jgi:YHS domain-containing protein
MFISNLVGMTVGLIFGVVFGRVGGLMGMMDGGMGGVMGGMMGAMLGVMLQRLYDGWAVPVTGILVTVIYLASLISLLRLVRQTALVRLDIDPVCGMKVDTKTALQYAYNNQIYYFCAPSCQKNFARTPEMFLQKNTPVPQGNAMPATTSAAVACPVAPAAIVEQMPAEASVTSLKVEKASEKESEYRHDMRHLLRYR